MRRSCWPLGAIATPQLLQLSGIGPADDLRAHGIRCVADLPVGQALSDHASITLSVTPRTTLPAPYGRPSPTALHAPAPTGEPFELLVGARPLDEIVPGIGAPNALPVMVNLPATGRGSLTLQSDDPAAPPLIRYGYLADERDRGIARHAVRVATDLIRSREFAVVAESDDAPGARLLADDGALDTWVASCIGTTVHTCATAPMGTVADGAGRVLGIDGLRVADTSLLPAAPHSRPRRIRRARGRDDRPRDAHRVRSPPLRPSVSGLLRGCSIRTGSWRESGASRWEQA